MAELLLQTLAWKRKRRSICEPPPTGVRPRQTNARLTIAATRTAHSVNVRSTNICAGTPGRSALTLRRFVPRSAAILAALLTITACRPARTIKLEWDAPTVAADGYRILLDDRVLMEIPPPPVDPSCRCLRVSVSVPRGRHTLKVIAYNAFGNSPPAAIAVVE
jgi:hypothetical protein